MTGTEVRCNTLKEAELIPDSAVPYTLPESRCNSSNRQRSKFESEAREGVRSAHTPHGACEAMDTQGMPEKWRR